MRGGQFGGVIPVELIMRETRTSNRREFVGQGLAFGAVSVAGSVATEGRGDEGHAPAGRKIRVGVIGCGKVSQIYLPHLSKCPFVELVSTCDKIPERAKRAAAKFQIPNYYPHINDLLGGAPFDLMVNLTDMQEHGRLNKIALEAGRNVWSEKPLANSYIEGRALLELAREKKIRIWGAPAVVTSPQFAFMARTLSQGALGRVAAAHASYGHLGPGWSAFFYEKLGGSMPDLGVYNFTTLTGLLGPARAVAALTGIVTPTRTVEDKGKIRVQAEDNSMMLLDHGNGTFSHIQCGFNYFDPHGHDGSELDRNSISIIGTHGCMELVGYDWAPHAVDLATRDQPTPKRNSTDAGGWVWQQGAAMIAECLSTGKEPLITAEHALHVVEILEAARTSGETGSRVELRSTFKWPLIS
jgi:predicted dehydrogenase